MCCAVCFFYQYIIHIILSFFIKLIKFTHFSVKTEKSQHFWVRFVIFPDWTFSSISIASSIYSYFNIKNIPQNYVKSMFAMPINDVAIWIVDIIIKVILWLHSLSNLSFPKGKSEKILIQVKQFSCPIWEKMLLVFLCLCFSWPIEIQDQHKRLLKCSSAKKQFCIKTVQHKCSFA